MSFDPRFVFAERRFGLVAPVVLPLQELPQPFRRIGVVLAPAVIGRFRAAEEDRHILSRAARKYIRNLER
jgi:hypothetical protein